MKKSMLPLVAFGLACGGLGPDEQPKPPLDDDTTPATGDSLCVDGRSSTPTWEGEYPGPPVDVQQAVPLPFRLDPCGNTEGTCTLPPGLYHPWSEARVATGFATIRSTLRYQVTQDYTGEEGINFQKGEVIEVHTYLGEGFCAWRRGGTDESGYCPDTFDEGMFVLLNPEANEQPSTQLFQAACQTGERGWFVVEDALNAPGVEAGVITGYGSVGPHGSPNGL